LRATGSYEALAALMSVWYYLRTSQTEQQNRAFWSNAPSDMQLPRVHHRSLRIGKLFPMVFAVLFAATFVQRLALAQSGTAQPLMKTFDLASDPLFANYKQLVTAYAREHLPKIASDFCVVGYMTSDNLKNALVIWRQGREIILWYGGDQDLDASQKIINLNTDVVATENDLHGSTYLVTQAWVREVTATCNRSGVNVHVPARVSSHH
jgi:hypothetical protein